MSWLFGRGRDDEEDGSSEYTDEYTSSEGEEDEDDEPTEKEELEPEPEDPSESESEDGEEEPKDDEPMQNGNGHAPTTTEEVDEKDAEPPEANADPKEMEPAELETEKEGEKVAETKEEEPAEEIVEEEPSESEASANEDTTPEEAVPEPVGNENEPSETGEKEPESTTKEPENPVENGDPPLEESQSEAIHEDNSSNEKVEETEASEGGEQTKEEADEEKVEDEVEEVTSTHEKRSLLVLAAEHDRVDILKAILADDSEDRDTLLNSSIPPLHISIAYGSTNAVQSLLRMGADPSVRPDIQKIKEEADAEGEEQLVDIPNTARFDKLSAWELAFGKGDGDQQKEYKKSSSWFGSGDKKSIEIAPSKLEGIRHAFTAEGLRCIGSDEVDRLKQLIDSGMPSTIDIGGKNLYDWAVEMGALQCEELLRPTEADRSSKEEASSGSDGQQPGESTGTASVVRGRSRPGTESLPQLANRIDELKSLSEALSSCLDNLAEEVSVCHGLLLMGGGAAALASHVKSLKTLKENKMAELERLEEAWENSEDELAYWVKECGEAGREIAELMSPAIISSGESDRQAFEGTPEEEQAERQQLKAEAALLENKIRKLRASISDLSEESTRDLAEVEKRGLSGGIKLVRNLRDEIREIEFALNEAKSAEALCHAKIKLIQSKMGQAKKQSLSSSSKSNGEAPIKATATATGESSESAPVESLKSPAQSHAASPAAPVSTQESQGEETARSTIQVEATTPAPVPAESKPSEKIASGKSTAIALKNHKDQHGYFSVDLWRILLRIIGLGSNSRPLPPPASTVMIV